ncbi:MAG: hypothetical protein Q4C22_01670 [Bacillota bacterium]|nr:hypothetical protein [Bacillota bacterium]
MRKSNIIDMRSRSPYVYKSDSYSLRDCLECCTQADLEDIAYYQGLEIPEGLKREALVNLLEPQILRDFRRLVPYFLPEDIELLDVAVSGRPSYPEDMMGRDLYIYDLGFLFFFYENETIHPVLPEELQAILAEALKDGLLDQMAFRQEIADYVEALLNFYGIYELDQLVKIWNAHHRKKMDWEEAWGQVTGMEDVLACYWCDEGLVVSDYFSDYQEVDLFLDMAEDCPYYDPTPADIRKSMEGGIYRIDSTACQRLDAFVKELRGKDPDGKWDPEALLRTILDAPLFDIDGEAMLEALKEEGFPLDKPEELQTLVRYYEEYRKGTRSWILRGHLPSELPSEFSGPENPAPEPPSKRPFLRTIRGGKA